MSEELYEKMDWPEIEAIVYSESVHPGSLLGPHKTDKGLLIQAYFPDAKEANVILSEKTSCPMERVDEAGYFAILLAGKDKLSYQLEAVYENGERVVSQDPYRFPSIFTESDLKRFEAGIHYEIYEKMGAHPMKLEGVEGVHFAVWAPNAWRVSVVGDFCLWDGRRYQMNRLGDSGIFELFIPGLKPGQLYKYEVKFKGGNPALKSDPYGNQAEVRPRTASVIADLNEYTWQDGEWLKNRKKTDSKKQPMFVYEVHLGSFKKPEDEREFYNYREIAPMLADYVKEMGYTHVELMPVMEHPLDESWGYQVTGYYAPTSRYGSPADFMYFMDYMHQKGIGVILDWVPAHFPRDTSALADFDGTGLYEHKDPRRGAHPHWGTLIFNYGRPQVSNFLIANALFWVEKYHADGIRMDAVASMLYLDYGKNDGEWIPNIYGGNENLEAVEFLKHLNSIFKKKKNGAVLIAEESTAWPKITGAVEEDGLGFDYKWNMGWMNDFLGYMRCDPYFRKHHYGEMTFSMIYAYSEDFILSLSHDEVVHGKGSMLGKMPGETLEMKAANLRAAYGFMLTHPGKKHLFMAQDFGQLDEWDEHKGIQWELLQYPLHKNLQEYMKALLALYRSEPALYALDYDPAGFEWINCTRWEESIVVFLRRSRKTEETLIIVCNFDTVSYDKFTFGVPMEGKYKEIFNSDSLKFGGTGFVNPRVKVAKKGEWDERPYRVEIKLAPLSVAVFRYIPVPKTSKPKKEVTNRKAKEKKNVSEATKVKKTVEKMKTDMME